MTFDELKQHLIEAGFQWADPAAPAPEPDPEPDPEPTPAPAPENDVQEQLLAAVKELTGAIQKNAINTITFDKPEGQTAEDILGEILAGKKPE